MLNWVSLEILNHCPPHLSCNCVLQLLYIDDSTLRVLKVQKVQRKSDWLTHGHCCIYWWEGGRGWGKDSSPNTPASYQKFCQLNSEKYWASSQFRCSVYCEKNNCIHVLPVSTCQWQALACTSEYTCLTGFRNAHHAMTVTCALARCTVEIIHLGK